MMPGIIIRPFGYEDVPQALELSDAAGWNQISDDWHRILDLEPNRCLGAWSNDGLVGTTTFVTYGRELAWIGMVLVHPDHRRQGIGSHLFEETMTRLHGLGVNEIGLDATELGRPLYRSAGFVDLAPIVRWQGVPNSAVRRASRRIIRGARASHHASHSAPRSSVVRTARDEDLDEIVSLDRELCGLDRGFLLEHLFGEDQSIVFMLDEGNGYGVLRPGRIAWQFGPLVVQERSDAADLLDAAADHLNGNELIVDSVEGSGYGRMLVSAGLEPRRRLTRMTYGRAVQLLTNEHTASATCFAWG